eukprot:972019-Pleurochrysis_carterae.AAC.2
MRNENGFVLARELYCVPYTPFSANCVPGSSSSLPSSSPSLPSYESGSEPLRQLPKAPVNILPTRAPSPS